MISEESQLFESLFASWSKDGVFPAANAGYLQSSGLQKQILRQIWEKCAHGKPFLTKDEFFVALRLVALGQQGKEIDEKQQHQDSQKASIPNQGQQFNPLIISPVDMQEYKNDFKRISLGLSFVGEKKLVDFFTKEKQAPLQVVQEILNFCNPFHTSKIELEAFMVIFHMFNTRKSGISMPSNPNQLPKAILSLIEPLLQKPEEVEVKVSIPQQPRQPYQQQTQEMKTNYIESNYRHQQDEQQRAYNEELEERALEQQLLEQRALIGHVQGCVFALQNELILRTNRLSALQQEEAHLAREREQMEKDTIEAEQGLDELVKERERRLIEREREIQKQKEDQEKKKQRFDEIREIKLKKKREKYNRKQKYVNVFDTIHVQESSKEETYSVSNNPFDINQTTSNTNMFNYPSQDDYQKTQQQHQIVDEYAQQSSSVDQSYLSSSYSYTNTSEAQSKPIYDEQDGHKEDIQLAPNQYASSALLDTEPQSSEQYNQEYNRNRISDLTTTPELYLQRNSQSQLSLQKQDRDSDLYSNQSKNLSEEIQDQEKRDVAFEKSQLHEESQIDYNRNNLYADTSTSQNLPTSSYSSSYDPYAPDLAGSSSYSEYNYNDNWNGSNYQAKSNNPYDDTNYYDDYYPNTSTKGGVTDSKDASQTNYYNPDNYYNTTNSNNTYTDSSYDVGFYYGKEYNYNTGYSNSTGTTGTNETDQVPGTGSDLISKKRGYFF
ncbi:MAG: hypothetical protein EZS28_016099 [Streblomastix strix]|uniref:EH domain-containing protein n=1 Tax=Streblomastix strix TaxID=222440 RepID=A0A5J4W1H1_9EUKA|nr:MAG: hypothetical protein EZS28_016099 [Streblomastix strix]